MFERREPVLKKKIGFAEIASFASDVGFGICLGIIVDHLAKTTWIFTCIGALLGVALAIILKKARK